MRSLILSQCRDLRMGVIWEDLAALTTALSREWVSEWVDSSWHISTIRLYSVSQKKSPHRWYAVAEWYGAGLATVRLRVRIPPTTAVYQRQLSVPSLRGRLTGIPCDALAPYPWSCGFGWCLAEGYETEISAAPWALRLGKGLYFFTWRSYAILSANTQRIFYISI